MASESEILDEEIAQVPESEKTVLDVISDLVALGKGCQPQGEISDISTIIIRHNDPDEAEEEASGEEGGIEVWERISNLPETIAFEDDLDAGWKMRDANYVCSVAFLFERGYFAAERF
jgi:hypothetical protein